MSPRKTSYAYNFSDGSEFDDSKTVLLLLDYFKRCGNCVAHRDSR